MNENIEVEFDIYGNCVKGILIHQNDEEMKIKCTYDELGVYDVGEIVSVHKSHLKKQT